MVKILERKKSTKERILFFYFEVEGPREVNAVQIRASSTAAGTLVARLFLVNIFRELEPTFIGNPCIDVQLGD